MTKFDTLSDQELSLLLNEGNRHVFDFIYRKYLPGLLRFAMRNIYVREDCEEIIQDAFLSIWARHSELQVESFQNYLLTMVRNRVLNYLKHRDVRKVYDNHFKMFSSVYDTIDVDKIDQEFIYKSIELKLSQLPSRQQEAFRLRLHEHLSNADIAERMNVSKKTIEKYIFEAFSHLKTSFSIFPKG